jgi:hypothetical protein
VTRANHKNRVRSATFSPPNCNLNINQYLLRQGALQTHSKTYYLSIDSLCRQHNCKPHSLLCFCSPSPLSSHPPFQLFRRLCHPFTTTSISSKDACKGSLNISPEPRSPSHQPCDYERRKEAVSTTSHSSVMIGSGRKSTLVMPLFPDLCGEGLEQSFR